MIRMGIVDETGAMSLDFEVGEIDEGFAEEFENLSGGGEKEKEEESVGWVKVDKYKVCEQSTSNSVPCLDNADEKYERHCPKALDCVVPRPEGYRVRIPWPQSRDQVLSFPQIK